MTIVRSTNITWHKALVTQEDQDKRNGTKGAVLWLTGVSTPYEEPANPEIIVETDKHSVEECVSHVLSHLEERGILRAGSDKCR